ncbi:MAG: hypothetical protein C0601_04930 [Candidatus Muiribacterium halophilum]|uniref:Type II secretion system protein GspF domain-containing protein n=1 Tax=Muiribacterium halophilum TaxID=2053465 RepID=A0A2N5ZI52_MUIH1|nr:MAG: hypothetical protein C0601_04930 [Candidatus Muirbacterium halophilum]
MKSDIKTSFKELISFKKKMEFLQNIEIAVKAGRAFNKVAAIAGNAKFKELIDKGYMISEAMMISGHISKKDRDYLLPFENSGRLHEGIISLKQKLQNDHKSIIDLISGLAYPAFLAIAFTIINLAVNLFVYGLTFSGIINAIKSLFFSAIVFFFVFLAFNNIIQKFRKINDTLVVMHNSIITANSFNDMKRILNLRNATDYTSAAVESHLPTTMVTSISSGELSGELESTLKRLISINNQEMMTTMKATTKITGIVIYIIIALIYAAKIFSSWAGMLSF